MKLNSVLRFTSMILSPACAFLIAAVGCSTTETEELPLPPGAYVPPPEKPIPPENSALSTEPAQVPAPEEPVTFPKDSDEQVFTQEELSEKQAPGPAPAQQAAVQKKNEPAFAKDDIIYTIRKNDTLSGIAHRHGTTAPALAEYNGISLKSKIYPGKTLHIPATAKTSAAAAKTTSAAAIPAGATLYTVRAGDTLGGIAQKHSVRTADLAAANDLDVRKPIRTGQKLIIPASAKKTTDAAAKPAPAKKAAAAKPAAAKPAASTKPAPAAKKSTAKKSDAPAAATKPAPAAKKAAAPAEKQESAPAAGQNSADDLLKNIGSEPAAQQAQPVPAAPAAGAVSVTPPAKEEAFDEDNTIVINIEREMTLEETAKAFDRSYSIVKKLNPAISPDTRLKAGTPVKIPIF